MNEEKMRIRSRILELLEQRGHTAAQLAEHVPLDALGVIRLLKSMATDGFVYRVPDGIWFRQKKQAPPAAPPGARAARHRQPKPKPAETSGVAWWVGRDREEFSAAHAVRLPGIQASRFGQWRDYSRPKRGGRKKRTEVSGDE